MGFNFGEDGESVNSLESVWADVKRANVGMFRKMSLKHIQRYLAEFTGRLTIRDLDTLDHMALLAKGVVGKSLPRNELISENGRSNPARRPKWRNKRIGALDDF